MTEAVVPAQAGTHTPCPLDGARPAKTSSIGGYGSPPARGRHLRFISLLALGLASLAGIGDAVALDYPTKPVRWIVGYPAGGSTDIVARLIGQYLSEKLGQQFVIENRPGAGNNLGKE